MERRIKLDNKDLNAITDALVVKAETTREDLLDKLDSCSPAENEEKKNSIYHLEELAEEFRCMITEDDEEDDG